MRHLVNEISPLRGKYVRESSGHNAFHKKVNKWSKLSVITIHIVQDARHGWKLHHLIQNIPQHYIFNVANKVEPNNIEDFFIEK